MIPKVKLAVGIFILIVQLFLYINAEAVYGPYAGMIRNVMLAYFILLAIFSPFVLKILAEIGPQDIPNFSIGFILTAIVMLVVVAVFPQFTESMITGEIEKGLTLALGFGFLHALVKGFNEEVLFRGVFIKIMGGTLLAAIISSVFFGIFHFSMLMALVDAAKITMTQAYMSMGFLSILGFVWYLVYKRFGLMGSTGSHLAYNLAALGVLPVLFGV